MRPVFRPSRFSLRYLALTILATTLAGTSTARAQYIISNLDGNDGTYSTLVGNLNRSKALGFTMPSTDPYLLNSIVMRLDVSNVSMTIAAGLYGSSAGVPTGPALVTFNIPAFTSTGLQNYTFLPNSAFLLQPSTTYFLVAYGTSTGSSSNYIDWYSSVPGVTPTGVATFAGAFSDNTGAVTVPPTTPSSSINSFAVNATAVPELSPGLMLSVIATTAGAATLHRKLRRRPTTAPQAHLG